MTHHPAIAALGIRLAQKRVRLGGLRDDRWSLAWTEFLGLVPTAAAALADKLPHGEDVWISDDRPLAGLLTTLALAYSGKIPVLGSTPPKGAPTAHLEGLSINDMARADTKDVATILGRCFARTGAAVAFATSGSTGDVKIVHKDWRALLNEAMFLKSLVLPMADRHGVLALVPPYHLFGFLYTFLMPLISQESVRFAIPVNGVVSVNEKDAAEVGIMVAVPALWPLVKSLAFAARIPLVVSSGAAIGIAREEEFRGFRSEGLTDTRLVEVLGSTETGGIGWRECAVDEPQTFTRFAPVEIDRGNDGAMILSPFLYPENEAVALMDQLELDSSGERFRHLGRSDRVFKWSGKRHSLKDIEDALLRVTSAERVQCFFLVDPHKAQGGELVACLVGTKIDPDIALRQYSATARLPVPTRIYSVVASQLNGMGKIGLKDLASIDPALAHLL